MSSDPPAANLDSICGLLRDRYEAAGVEAGDRLRTWITGSVPYAHPEILARHLAPEHVPLLFDCFWQVLPFGTGGRRGRVGYGPNRINSNTIAVTIQGHCRFLRRRFPDRKDLAVIVANDVRTFRDVTGTYAFLGGAHPLLGLSARSLARLASEIYAANGIVAYVAEPENDDALLSTPELSFLIGELGAVGGIVMSASHNPPDDNGVKLYDDRGSQPVAPQDQELLDIMAEGAPIQTMKFDDALRQGRIRAIPGDRHARYVAAYVELFHDFAKPAAAPPIVYTPLCGCGLSTVGDVLGALGFPWRTPPAEGPDGSFQVIPFRSPNPEVPQSTEPARRFADEIGSPIVLSSDPDADRVGLEAKLQDGKWYHFDGNQIAAILTYALMLDPAGPRRSGLVIETLVTNKLIGRIAELRGDSPLVDDLLVGFKYVADVLKSLQESGRYRHVQGKPADLVLAAEESHGVCMLPSILDKDSTPACMFLAGLFQRLHAEGKTLLDYYVRILEEVGSYESVSRSLMMSGAEGELRKKRIMDWLRRTPPAEIAGARVLRIVDHWDETEFGPFKSDSDHLPRNVIELFSEHFVLIVRPSGTEPKLKFYCHLLPEGAPRGIRGRALLDALREQAARVASQAYGDLLAPLGLALGEEALLLPDIIDLDGKLLFDRDVLPELRRRLAAERAPDLSELLTWLGAACSSLVPGADPLPALKAPLARFVVREALASSSPLAGALATWASS